MSVATAPGASVAITVAFPSGKTLHHSGTAGSPGAFTWRFKEPKGVAKGKNRTATVTVKVTDSSGHTKLARTRFSG